MAKPVPPRLHAIIARKPRIAVVFRRGPAKQVASCLWDLETDRVTLGQWLKGRIYERRCAISPDGRHMLVFAANHKAGADGTGGAWTALSRTPWLTALDLWAKGDCWNGGGGFTTARRYWLNGGHGELRRTSGLTVVESPLGPQRNNECLGIYFPRLVHEGWEEVFWSPDRAEFVKEMPRGWRLHKIAEAGFPAPQGAGVYRDHHLLEGPDGAVIDGERWEWADRDGPDLVYAEGGCLWRRRILDRREVAEPRLIHDFAPMVFEERVAPY